MQLKTKEKIVPKTWVEISKSALRNNLNVFKRRIGKDVSIMAVVKANAYGHGLIEIAKTAHHEGVEWFGVDRVEDGILLRDNGIKGNILVMGYMVPANLEVTLKNNLSFVAYEQEIVVKLRHLSRQGLLKKFPAKIHLKIETGTGRQGLEGKELVAFAKDLKDIPGVSIEGLYTHYANIEDTTDHSFAEKQLSRFTAEKALLEKNGIVTEYSHTACSAAAILFPETHFNLIRLGISMYGLWPSKETHAVALRSHREIKLKPVLSWKTTVAQVKSYAKGTSIGYGLSESLTRNSKIAVLPVGYWDGFDRGLGSIGSVLIGGNRCKIVGRICMNMMMADVTDLKKVASGDQVILLGTHKKESISAEEIAGKIGTINYELVTRINPALERILVD